MSRSDDDENALIVTPDPKGQTKECERFGLGFGPTVKSVVCTCLLQTPETILSPTGRASK